MAALRQQRQREMVRIAWRDLAGGAPVADILAETSAFADAAIVAAVDFAARELGQTYGKPRSTAGEPQPLIVLGMGKLGGGELNFSSDIDLIFVFPEKGETDGARSIDNEDFFTRLGRLVIRILGERTSEGIVHRVDMRLRPFGDSGPLTVSGAFLDNYLQTHGRDWERYAWIKARAITGAPAWKLIHAESVRPFVYRRYLDFGVFESLREMKALIEKEVARRDLADHVKLGPGRHPRDRIHRAGLPADTRRAGPAHADPVAAGGAAAARRREIAAGAGRAGARSRLSVPAADREPPADARRCAESHACPTDALTRERIAATMGFRDWETCARRARAASRARHPRLPGSHLRAARRGDGRDARRQWHRRGVAARRAGAAVRRGTGGARLRGRGAGGAVAARVPRRRAHSSGSTRRAARGWTRCCRACWRPSRTCKPVAVGTPLDVLRRVLKVLEAIGSRSAYFALLNENAQVRRKLVELAALGEFLATQIASHPLLLDELLDESSGGLPPPRAELEREIARAPHAHADEDEPERQVEMLRQFQRAAIFRVAMADLTGRIPLMRVSDYLTEIAEIIVERGHAAGLGADDRAVRRAHERRWARRAAW